MDNQQLAAIAGRFGTPCFVFDETELDKRMRAVREMLAPSVGLCY